MSSYYNEHDPVAAEWLRELIKAGLIAAGEVDERSIEDVTPSDLKGFTQCHFFAGIGIWSHALRLAGWPDDQPVWTGSCPCQPFSAAGKGKGTADERHLWPAFFHLIGICRPRVVFGEQVASPGGLGWFDLVSADMEAADYAIGAIDLCAAGFGAPHIRQRLFFVADAQNADRRSRERTAQKGIREAERRERPAGRLPDGPLEYADPRGLQGLMGHPTRLDSTGDPGRMADAGGDQTVLQGADRQAQPSSDRTEDGIFSGSGSELRSTVGDATQRGRGILRHARKQGSGRYADLSGHTGLMGHPIYAALERLTPHGDQAPGRPQQTGYAAAPGDPRRMADADGSHTADRQEQRGRQLRQFEKDGLARCVADTRIRLLQEPRRDTEGRDGPGPAGAFDPGQPRATNGFWRDADWVRCRDERWRPVEAGTFPLAHGNPGRMGRLRGYGNAISPYPAKAVIEAYRSSIGASA